MPTSEHDLTKIHFTLADGSVVAGESLWAEPLGGGRYRIRNTPYFVDGIALDDVVRCSEHDDEAPEFVERLQSGGNETVRLIADETLSRAQLDALCALLRAAGATAIEGGFGGCFLVCTVPQEKLAVLLQAIAELEQEGSVRCSEHATAP